MMKLKSLTRILIAVSAVIMVITYFVPVWQILMWAPQYPEGLEMKIWLYTLSGDYKIISGLNHYIGMKHIEVEMFPEFSYMVYVVGFLIAFGLITVLANRKIMVYLYLGLILAAGVAGLVDFYQWGYDYGHNLDPTAAIVVPGMAYQPPLIGTKQLLNFTAYSGPDAGGWLFATSGILAILGIIIESRHKKTETAKTHAKEMAAALLFVFACTALTACSAKPEPLTYGKDGCHFCKMTLMDNRFGSEVVTKKGKIYKFDDFNCLQKFLETKEVPTSEISTIVITDFSKPGTLIDARTALFVTDDEIKSPMGSQTAAFASREHINEINPNWIEKSFTWKE